jgi:ectoine hydroxylase
MKLTDKEVSFFREEGYLLMENLFSGEEVQAMLDELPAVLSEDTPRRILEKSGAVRSFFAAEKTNDVFKCVVQLDKLVTTSSHLLDDSVYIHQTKINSKHAMVGDWWEWHQDFPYWYIEDGMPDSKVLTAMIFLNDVSEFTGPMLIVPGSHLAGLVGDVANDSKQADGNEWFDSYQNSTPYMTMLTASLKYTLKQNTLAAWIKKKGIVSMKGAAGSALFFHGSVFHASSNNMSPWNRSTFLVTYNSTSYAPNSVENPRPDFLCNRDFTPITPIKNELLLERVKANETETIKWPTK